MIRRGRRACTPSSRRRRPRGRPGAPAAPSTVTGRMASARSEACRRGSTSVATGWRGCRCAASKAGIVVRLDVARVEAPPPPRPRSPRSPPRRRPIGSAIRNDDQYGRRSPACPEPPWPDGGEQLLRSTPRRRPPALPARARAARGPCRSARREPTADRASCRSWRCQRPRPARSRPAPAPTPRSAESRRPRACRGRGRAGRRGSRATTPVTPRRQPLEAWELVGRTIAVLREQRRPAGGVGQRAEQVTHAGSLSYARPPHGPPSPPSHQAGAHRRPVDARPGGHHRGSRRQGGHPGRDGAPRRAPRGAAGDPLGTAGGARAGRPPGDRHVRQGRHGRSTSSARSTPPAST